jgi:thiol-disulfide isomerase/thioredoxin
MRVSYRMLVVLLGVVIVAGCARERPRKPTTSRVAPPPGAPTLGTHIGNLAPDIEGVDLDGERFKLSDYRGKVVVLDFWGDWCGPCRSMYPHNRHLVKKYEGKPFAFLGVNYANGRDTKESLRALRAEGKITWRVWLDEPRGKHAEDWRIDGFPHLYFIDAKGVIRDEIEGAAPGEDVNAIVESLMREAAEAGKTS